MADNVRHLSPKNKAPSVEDAKCVQRLGEHLQVLRKHRDFLADKRVVASAIQLSILLSEAELPPELRNARGHDE